jgi:hypothetical protein
MVEVQMKDDKAPGQVKRGRPPGSTNAAKASRTESENIRQALATMNSAYEALAMGLMLVKLPETAVAFSDTAKTLEESNKKAFESSPKLAAMIARVGTGGGAAAFVIAHAVAIAGVMNAARSEMAAKLIPTEGDGNTDA